ncbi:hypothetical protein BGCPKDLD_3889 [Methylorubrum suomiense]|uniref:Uncharacterized protein n=1 Tax=Methylorubrum suomiense TaxID=144191 RepID=A0ABQ4UYM1_9HYPH|nr:hypothetical protein BGCPKDLD_3889 [Methylorubrum suomiense]
MAERKIGGVVYRCEKVPADQGIALFGRASKVLGVDSLAIIRDGSNRAKAMEEYLVLALSPNGNPTELAALIAELVGMCQAHGGGGYDPCVIGVKPESMEDAVEVAFWCLEVQFRSFLSVALSPPPPSPTESGQAA